MDPALRFKQAILLIGDLVIMYAALFGALFIRYAELTYETLKAHFFPFSLIFAIWVVIFYVAGLYETRWLKNDLEFVKKLVAGLTAGAILSVILFYFIPALGITPKTNLFLFLAIFALLEYLYRSVFNAVIASGTPQNRILFVGSSPDGEKLINHIRQNPQLGYEIAFWMRDGLADKEWEHLHQIILTSNVNLIVLPAHIKKDQRAAQLIYKNLAVGIEAIDLEELYQAIFRKVPLGELEETWFLENIARPRRLYETIKRPIEFLLATALFAVLLPIMILIGVLVLITSGRPIIFAQRRVGEREKEFTLYKFRTMRQDAEATGPQWSKADDARVTTFGKFLRSTHLDELPQLLNVMRGELSFVGPRPERPEFVKSLRASIPYYELRHLVRPGITGWAQVNFRYGWSAEDAAEKLQYDIYFIKNRSLLLDLLITLRTLKTLFATPK